MSVLHAVVVIQAILVMALAAWVLFLRRRLAKGTAVSPASETAGSRPGDANFASSFRSNPCLMTITRVSDARFEDVNESFERSTGYSRDEVLGRSYQEFGMWLDPDDLAAADDEMRRNGRLDGREIRFRTKRGVPRTAVYSTSIIMFGGQPCVLAMGLDVTDRKHAEVQAAALREELAHVGRLTLVDALTGSIAHEINQPLTAVMANAEAALHFLAARPPMLGELGETLNEIVRDNKRAGDVLRRMRTLLKKDRSRYEPIELNGIVREVVTLIESNAVGRRIAIDVELASNVDLVLGDRILIQQVVLNLLMNALDAVETCESANRRVHLQTRAGEQAAVIEVRDQGPGLSDEAKTLLFEPFYTTKEDGMGLGLSICRAIVTAHSGTLDARPNAGIGMTFSATFPLCPPLDLDQTRVPASERLQEQR